MFLHLVLALVALILYWLWKNQSVLAKWDHLPGHKSYTRYKRICTVVVNVYVR